VKLLFVTVILVLVSGCATHVSQSNLYWGNYSNTLYLVKKEPSAETKAAHEKELQLIVEKSKEMNLRVPPGIYAELGLYATNRGDKNAAQNYYRLEQEVYPEGAVLMKRTMSDTQAKL